MIYNLNEYEKRIKYRMNYPKSKYKLFSSCGETRSFRDADSEKYFFDNFNKIE